ncbi:MAG: anaerobic ribonucleoside-triphosphate reductase activating protein [Deltaproteobacteria bacterium]|nr:anaerobic ribonucleoside-triphosphate reductase activating protein [Deltaproteobacteria bacterium]
MIFGGIQKNSLIDYPGKVSCVLFVRGCNFRCPYCHNPGLLKGGGPEAGGLEEAECTDFLNARKGLLDGVVISGGEPTLQRDLTTFCKKVRSMGYPLKLDTNGSRPEVLHPLLEEGLVDYVAMDVKTDPALYGSLPGLDCRQERILESIRLLMESGLPYEFRTTCARPFVDPEIMERISGTIEGARLYVLQAFQYSENILDPGFFPAGGGGCSEEDLLELKALAATRVKECILR